MVALIKAAQLLLSLSILVVLRIGPLLGRTRFQNPRRKFYLFMNPGFSLFKKQIGETEWGIDGFRSAATSKSPA